MGGERVMHVVRQRAISFGHAVRGIGLVVKHEHNARIHVAAMVAVVLLAMAVDVPVEQFGVLVLAIALVFVAEIVNSAIENILDLVHPAMDERVRVIKDIAAGAVLVSSIAAVVIAVFVFGPRL